MLDYHILDVFTDRPFAGNPLAVVLGADGLTSGQMLRIAREFNLSETIFVQTPDDPAHAAKVRIFFPSAEIPFAGHPTIGCAILLAELRGLAGPVVLEEVAGLVPVTIADGLAELTAPVLPAAVDLAVDPVQVAQALGVQPLAGAFRPIVLQGGPRFLFVPLATRDDLVAARPMEPAWSRLMDACGVDSAWCFVPDGAGRFRARMFSPGAGIPEDPATGSAAAIFAAGLLAAGALHDGTRVLEIRQGVEMGRPSLLRVTVEVAGGALRQVRVAGRAVRIAEGRIRKPQEGEG